MLFLRWYFWIAPHLLLGVLVAGFLRRGLQRQLPVFFSYLVFDLLQFPGSIQLRLYSIPTQNLYRSLLPAVQKMVPR
jgi:hypothetical protein